MTIPSTSPDTGAARAAIALDILYAIASITSFNFSLFPFHNLPLLPGNHLSQICIHTTLTIKHLKASWKSNLLSYAYFKYVPAGIPPDLSGLKGPSPAIALLTSTIFPFLCNPTDIPDPRWAMIKFISPYFFPSLLRLFLQHSSDLMHEKH